MPRWLAYYLAAEISQSQFRQLMYGGTKQGIGLDDLQNLSVLLPAIEEQQSVVSFLDSKTAQIDTLIAKKQRMIDLLHEKRQALISEAVTKGLDPSVPMKDSGIEWLGRVPEHWRITRLGWVTAEINDINHEMPASVETGVPFLSAKDLLDDGTLNFTDNIKLIGEDDYVRLSRKVRPRRNDIIYSRIGACLGKARIVETDERFLVSYSCCVVRVSESIADARFLRHLLDGEMVLTEATMRTQGIGVPDLGLREISRFPVPVPPIEEQRSIAKFLDQQNETVRRLIGMCESQIDKLREYRQTLISAAVTGKIDVRKEVA